MNKPQSRVRSTAKTTTKPVKKTANKTSVTKAQEIETFRAEVQKYIETGTSTVLTVDERVKLRVQREAYKLSQMPWYKRKWDNVRSLWTK